MRFNALLGQEPCFLILQSPSYPFSLRSGFPPLFHIFSCRSESAYHGLHDMASDPNEPYTISPAQFASYDRDGYLILHDALSPLVAKQLLLWSRDVHSWPNVPEKHMAYTETLSDGTIGICRTENFANLCVCS